jgi:hypothetical protein
MELSSAAAIQLIENVARHTPTSKKWTNHSTFSSGDVEGFNQPLVHFKYK